jgi:hypothetical protein
LLCAHARFGDRQSSAAKAARQSATEAAIDHSPMTSSRSPNSNGAKACAARAGSAEKAGALAVALGTEHCERHGAARNGQKPVAGAVEHGEQRRRRRADDRE